MDALEKTVRGIAPWILLVAAVGLTLGARAALVVS